MVTQALLRYAIGDRESTRSLLRAIQDHIDGLAPGDLAQLLCLQGSIAYDGERYDVAEKTFRKASELVPTVPDYIGGLIDALLAQGKTTEANDVLRAAVGAADLHDGARLLAEHGRRTIPLPDGRLPWQYRGQTFTIADHRNEDAQSDP